MTKKLTLACALLLSTSVWFVGSSGLGSLYRKFFVTVGTAIHPDDPANADFFFPWYGSRALLVDHRDPYSAAVTREIRQKVATENNGIVSADSNWGQFIYPVYSAFVLAPFLWMSFPVAQSCFFGLLLACILGSTFCWLYFLGIRCKTLTAAALAAAILFIPPAVQGLMLRQVGVLVACFIAIAAVLIRKRRLYLAGWVLALATIKPQMVALLIVWLMAWSAGDWKKRKGLTLGFVSGMTLLLAASQWALAGWIQAWWRGMRNARDYGVISIVEMLDGHTLGLVFTLLIAIYAAYVLIKIQPADAASEEFAFGFTFILIVQLLILPLMAGFNQLLAVPGFLLLAKQVWPLREGREATMQC